MEQKMLNKDTPLNKVFLPGGRFQGQPIGRVPKSYLQKLIFQQQEPLCALAYRELERRGYSKSPHNVFVSAHALNKFTSINRLFSKWFGQPSRGGLVKFILKLAEPAVFLAVEQENEICTGGIKWIIRRFSTVGEPQYEIVTLMVDKQYEKER